MLPAAETVSRPAGEPHAANASRDVAIVDRLRRYDAAVWRQLAQTLFTLQALKRRRGFCNGGLFTKQAGALSRGSQ